MALTLKKVPFELVEPPGSGWHEERGRFKVGYGTEAYRELLRPIPGSIPAIIAAWDERDRFKLNESTAILEWLDEVVPDRGPRLLPGDANERAMLRIAIRVHDSSLDGKVRALFPLLTPALRQSEESPAKKAKRADLDQEAAAKLQELKQPLALLGTYCDSYGGAGTQDEFFNGKSWTAVDGLLLSTLTLLEKILLALLEDRPDEVQTFLPGRLRTWHAAAKQYPEVQGVMEEMLASFDDWVHRKVTGKEFSDGWWRPDQYGGKRNARFP